MKKHAKDSTKVEGIQSTDNKNAVQQLSEDKLNLIREKSRRRPQENCDRRSMGWQYCMMEMHDMQTSSLRGETAAAC
ncbi:MAG: hypothetical protein LBJ95_03175 [Oscillospiraceae bacterium]|jgi:hypothetical protein|nr:hypothetical protein [Oscillospiraceae bacterium]